MRLTDSPQMREMDRFTIEDAGVPGLVLMENAARSWIAAAEPILRKADNIYVFCGSGNNGGDGYAIARNLVSQGYGCLVIAVRPPKSHDCRKNAEVWSYYGKTLTWEEFQTSPILFRNEDALIDAILGTGIETAIRGPLLDVIKRINFLPGTKLAVDIATGVNASTGDVMGAGVKADLTVTFQKEKVGHHLHPGKEFTGELICQKISILEKYSPGDQGYYLIERDMVASLMPNRKSDAYKNNFGHAGIWCGSSGTLGAAFLAGYAALLTGAGLSTMALPSEEQNAFLSKAPELMTCPQEKLTLEQLEKFDSLTVGCGIGRDPEKWKEMEKLLLKTSVPLAFDADAFYGIKDLGEYNADKMVLTPHPGEFARISGFPKPENNRERLEQGTEFAKKYSVVLVLKGAPTIIFNRGNDIYINGSGNAGMATAGSGDVLAGMVGGFLAQKLPPLVAALISVLLHGESGDLYSRKHGQETLTASRLLDCLPEAFELGNKSEKE